MQQSSALGTEAREALKKPSADRSEGEVDALSAAANRGPAPRATDMTPSPRRLAASRPAA